MLENLKKILNNSYAPYSGFHVGAILITRDNKEFSGVNIENASFAGTICAERVAINEAVSKGYRQGDFKEIHIINDGGDFAMPCFICRQTFLEFFDEETKIFVYSFDGNKKEYSMDMICPYPFSGDDLK